MTLTREIRMLDLPGGFTAVVRGEMPCDELPAWLAGVFVAVRDHLHLTPIARTGPPFARYTFLGDTARSRPASRSPARFPVTVSSNPHGCPPAPAAGTTHVGSYDDLSHTHVGLRTWLRDHGFTPAGPHWGSYLTNPFTDPHPTHWRTEMVMPYRDA